MTATIETRFACDLCKLLLISVKLSTRISTSDESFLSSKIFNGLIEAGSSGDWKVSDSGA
eukprot:CAMPEP_0180753430 /NCGR_PEP_ID=MMETSP1038_2-20121128/32662_1 /TAXON_ID=632150 /ORGANISM="Azadinium spinosum, Strain 3D9" /LENGTH=59 /DNA_ID=CAMNT_0022787283 /DNA_START=231 /DNA_END=406 /DNA_ORIENTATION=-